MESESLAPSARARTAHPRSSLKSGPPAALSLPFYQELVQSLSEDVLFLDAQGVVLFANKQTFAGTHWAEHLELGKAGEGWLGSGEIDPDATVARFKADPAVEYAVEVSLVRGRASELLGSVLILRPSRAPLNWSKPQIQDQIGDLLAVIMGSASRIERTVRAQPGVDMDAFNQTARIREYCLRLSELLRGLGG